MLSSIIAPVISTFRKATGSKKPQNDIEIEFQESEGRERQTFQYLYSPSGTLIKFGDDSTFIPAFNIHDILSGSLGDDEEFNDPNDFDDINDE